MTPVRTCVGCGQRAPQETLERFVRVDGGLRVDRRRRLGGRGAYLHGTRECWTAFAARRGAIRSLRCSPDRAERHRLVEQLAGAGRGA